VQVDTVLHWLDRRGTQRNREGMARFAIRSPKVFGVSAETMRPLAKRIGRNHELALDLWRTGWLEARLIATLIDDPARVTSSQMDAWARDFDNWAVCDSTCFHLFDRTPHAWGKARVWSTRHSEFVKRGAFALIAGLAVHQKNAGDDEFVALLPLIERGSTDERNFVRKAVNWALRQIGKRNEPLNDAAVSLATRLAASGDRTARWIGNDALRELTSSAVRRRLVARRAGSGR
jgi:3-methyladenine DNA glycosylase AlkD